MCDVRREASLAVDDNEHLRMATELKSEAKLRGLFG